MVLTIKVRSATLRIGLDCPICIHDIQQIVYEEKNKSAVPPSLCRVVSERSGLRTLDISVLTSGKCDGA